MTDETHPASRWAPPAAPAGPPPWHPPDGQQAPDRERPGAAPPAGQTPVGTVAPPRRAMSERLAGLDRQPTVHARGWRKLLGLGPKRALIEQDEDEKWLRAVFPRGAVTIAVAQPKGGSGKTTTALGLGAAFGLARGGGTVVWDNNELRGTLADRSFSAHRRTVVDLLDMWRRQTGQLGSEEAAWARLTLTDVTSQLNYQPTGMFYALGSSAEAGEQITADDFKIVRSILTRFFQVVIVDTGNNEVAANWLEAVHNADVLVVPTKWKKDHIKPAFRMIETLEGQKRAVAERCVVVGTNGPGDSVPTVRAQVTDWMGEGMRVLEVPTDPHLNEGAELDWTLMAPTTHRAYQHIGAVCCKVMADYFSSDAAK